MVVAMHALCTWHSLTTQQDISRLAHVYGRAAADDVARRMGIQVGIAADKTTSTGNARGKATSVARDVTAAVAPTGAAGTTSDAAIHTATGTIATVARGAAGHTSNRTRSRQQRAIYSRANLWEDNTIPYTFEHISESVQTFIKRAMGHIEQHTCIRFIPRTFQSNYLGFEEPADVVCRTSVGKLGGKQKVELNQACGFGSTTHELIHTLGFYHEHSRHDRDEYVDYHPENLGTKEHEVNFIKYTQDFMHSKGSPYDLNSIMHYRAAAFAKPGTGLVTLAPKDPCAKIGNRDALSDQDKWQINRLYQCPGTPAEPPPLSADRSLCKCTDQQTDYVCRSWRSSGYCDARSKYYASVSSQCTRTCGNCVLDPCTNMHAECTDWSRRGWCVDSMNGHYLRTHYVRAYCRPACDIPCLQSGPHVAANAPPSNAVLVGKGARFNASEWSSVVGSELWARIAGGAKFDVQQVRGEETVWHGHERLAAYADDNDDGEHEQSSGIKVLSASVASARRGEWAVGDMLVLSNSTNNSTNGTSTALAEVNSNNGTRSTQTHVRVRTFVPRLWTSNRSKNDICS